MARTAVYIVDDDAAVRDSMAQLLGMHGYETRQFADAADYLDEAEKLPKGCLLLDIRMPGMSGMELQQKLKTMHCTVPIIFVTGHGDVPMAVEAMHHGAFDFIQKPFRDQELLDRINQALTWDQEHRSDEDYRRGVIERFQSLTPREREVMDCVVRGLANKVIAMDLSLSQRTVEIHRARVMEKMNARSLADLVRMSLLVSREP